MEIDRTLAPLVKYLQRVPAVSVLSASRDDSMSRWWVKLGIDIHHRLAWRVVRIPPERQALKLTRV